MHRPARVLRSVTQQRAVPSAPLACAATLCQTRAMTDAEIRQRLNALLDELDEEDAASAEARSVVELDQSATGRLSRMDALQHQAMAQAQLRRRASERLRLQAALARLEEGEYGFCTDCGEEVLADRLAADPAIALCADCMRGR